MEFFEKISDFWDETLDYLADFWDSALDVWDDIIDFQIEDTDTYNDLSEACAEGLYSCGNFINSQPIEHLALAVFCCLTVIFIIFRIFSYFFRDTEVW